MKLNCHQREYIFGPFFFEGTASAGEAYVQVLDKQTMKVLENISYDNETYYCQQDETPLHHHRDVRTFFGVNFPPR